MPGGKVNPLALSLYDDLDKELMSCIAANNFVSIKKARKKMKSYVQLLHDSYEEKAKAKLKLQEVIKEVEVVKEVIKEVEKIVEKQIPAKLGISYHDQENSEMKFEGSRVEINPEKNEFKIFEGRSLVLKEGLITLRNLKIKPNSEI